MYIVKTIAMLALMAVSGVTGEKGCKICPAQGDVGNPDGIIWTTNAFGKFEKMETCGQLQKRSDEEGSVPCESLHTSTRVNMDDCECTNGNPNFLSPGSTSPGECVCGAGMRIGNTDGHVMVNGGSAGKCTYHENKGSGCANFQSGMYDTSDCECYKASRNLRG